MIGVIARKEFTLIWRDGRIKWTAGIIVLMLTVAAATAVERYRDIAAERGAAQALVEEQWQSQGEKNRMPQPTMASMRSSRSRRWRFSIPA